jgi:hypothetical protein
MRITICAKVLLVGACTMAGLAARGQSQSEAELPPASLEVAVTYDLSNANLVAGNRFWLQGGSVQLHSQFWHGLGVVADVAGLHTANANSSGVGLDLVTVTFGPRYTWSPAHRRLSLFGQALVGEANGLNSIFPSFTGADASAQGLAIQVGGGINWPLTRHISARGVEADWLRTQLPNSTTNVQNNLRIGTGLVYRFQ